MKFLYSEITRIAVVLSICLTTISIASSVGLAQSGPVLFVEPASMNFGDAVTGSQFVALPITLRNDGTSDLIVYTMQLVGSHPDDFRLVTAGFPFTLAATDTTAFGIIFAPTALGSKSAALRLVTNDPNAEIEDIPLLGNGVGSENLGQVTAQPIPASTTAFPGTQITVAVEVDMTGVNPSGSLLQSYQARLSWDPNVLIYAGFDPLVQSGNLPVAVDSAPAGTGEIEWYGSALLSGGSGGVVDIIDFTFLINSGIGTSSPLTLEMLEMEGDNIENLLPILTVTNSNIQVVASGVAPAIGVEPTNLDYDSVTLGSSATQTFLVTNEGIDDLNVSAMAIQGAEANQYAVESGSAPFTLSAGKSQEVVIGFTPLSDGLKEAEVRLDSNDPDESSLTVALVGTGTLTSVPDIHVAPLVHDFGIVSVGKSGSQQFTISNQGAADLTVSTATFVGDIPTHFSITSGDAPFTVGAGSSHNLVVQFNPDDPGFGETTLRLANNDPGEDPVDVALTTFALFEGDIVVTPSALNFGDVVLGTLVTQDVTIQNEGTGPFQVVSVGLSGGPQNDFSFGQINLGYIQPGESASIEINFVPVSAGAKSGLLKIFSEDQDEKLVEVNLNGTGVAAPDILVAPTVHDFGPVAIESSTSQTFRVRNVGTGDLDVSTSQLVGADPSDFGIANGGAPFTLAMGETQTMTVEFAPAIDGAKSADLRLANNDPDEDPTDIALSGSGFYVAPTEKPTLLSPSGSIETTTPEFEWTEVDRSISYRLVVYAPNGGGGSGAIILQSTYDAEAICTAGTCKVTPSGFSLSTGNYTWLAQGANPDGEGPWGVAP